MGLFQLDHFVQQLLTAFCRDDIALAVPGSLLGDVGLLARDLLLLIAVVLFSERSVDAALFHTLGVTAVVKRRAVVFDGQRFGGHTVEEITVV